MESSTQILGRVVNVQRFSLHDGPGIRTLVFLKGCSLECEWCANPEALKGFREVLFSPSKCIACGECVKIAKRGEVEFVDGALVLHREKIRPSQLEWAEACPTGALQVIGNKISVDEVLEKICSDMPFYEASGGGGVTFSGGEPLLQASFVEAVASRCHERGIHTAVETACNVPQRAIIQAARSIDLFICGFVSVDDAIYQRYAGGTNAQVIENLRWLAANDPERLCVRTPLIPGVNMGERQIRKNIDFLVDIGARYYDVLPFHRLGSSKYTGLGRTYSYSDMTAPDDDVVEKIRATIRRSGLRTEFPSPRVMSTPELVSERTNQ